MRVKLKRIIKLKNRSSITTLISLQAVRLTVCLLKCLMKKKLFFLNNSGKMINSCFFRCLSNFSPFLLLFFWFSTTNLPNNTTQTNDSDEEAESSRYPHYHLRLHDNNGLINFLGLLIDYFKSC